MTASADAAHIQGMKAAVKTMTCSTTCKLVLVCIACSGGGRDANGAYTLCALCEMEGITAPETVPEAA